MANERVVRAHTSPMRAPVCQMESKKRDTSLQGLRPPSAQSFAKLADLGVSSEPIRAYLRIRPRGNQEGTPYIHVLSDKEVLMTPPDSVKVRTRGTSSPVKYTFSKVFDGDAKEPELSNDLESLSEQSQFFTETTLPLVQDLLEGRNSLVFTYGVTNSGKTYTVQGNTQRGQAGILPRAMDVIFNSISGRECKKNVRPAGLSGVQPGKSDLCKSLLGLKGHTGSRFHTELYDVDPTSIPVSDDYRYSVWVSYVEVYNEKLYDLLEMQMPSLLARDTRTSDNANGTARRPLLLKSEVESGGKYVSGLKEIQVSSIQEARELLRCGQENRSVFGTTANRASSRSHSVFTIKVLRECVAKSSSSNTYTVSRMNIVDLAGSERIANTEITQGPRLKEAGSINKSLMCLGQCLETMRKNQLRAGIVPGNTAASSNNAAASNHGDARRRRYSIIPFRHSKLTELFQSFFTGDGKVIMIINVNPYGTGYEENANVMRFSAMAKDVGIHMPLKGPHTLDLSGASQTFYDAGSDSGDDQDEFVELLVAENERLRLRCEQAESMCLVIEKRVRDEMAQHLEYSLRKMQTYYENQLREEVRVEILY